MMTEEEYSRWKVTELKAELKRRGVPQTGLKLKKDFVDKLVELDRNAEGKAREQDVEEELGEGGVEEHGDEEQGQGQEPEPEPKPDHIATKVDKEVNASEPTPKEVQPTSQKVDVEQGDKPHDETVVSEEKMNIIIGDTGDENLPMRKPDVAQPDLESKSITEKAPDDLSCASTTATEVAEDMNKRKRRSQSPPPSSETVKKAKLDNDHPRVILKEEATPKDKPRLTSVIQGGGGDGLSHGLSTAILNEQKQSQPQKESIGKLDVTQLDSGQDKKQAQPQKSPDLLAPRQDARFKINELLSNSHGDRSAPDVDIDRAVMPAVHPATSGLYIRNFMRPLQANALKSHLIALASSPQSDLDPAILVSFFLDSIKTHAFVQFANTAAAIRVRSALHDAVWPNERNRNPLSVDFIPEEKMQTWIQLEQDSVSSRGGPRWEVIYEETDNGVEAMLREVGSLGARPGPRDSDKLRTLEPIIPTGPRASVEAGRRRSGQLPLGPSPSQSRGGGGSGFKALDDLFKSTKTKPKLYYLPAARDVVDQRLEKFDDLANRNRRPVRQGGDETRRFTFEDGDLFVDGGPEYGPRAAARMARRRGGGSWRR